MELTKWQREVLRRMTLSTRQDLKKQTQRIDALQEEISELRDMLRGKNLVTEQDATAISEERKRGRFIAVEGPDGAGKTTAVRIFREAIAKHTGISPLIVSGTPPFILIPESASYFLGYMQAMYADKIAPALAAGQWVVADRWFWSTRVYQSETWRDSDMARADTIAPDRFVLLSILEGERRHRLEKRGTSSPTDEIGTDAFFRHVSTLPAPMDILQPYQCNSETITQFVQNMRGNK